MEDKGYKVLLFVLCFRVSEVCRDGRRRGGRRRKRRVAGTPQWSCPSVLASSAHQRVLAGFLSPLWGGFILARFYPFILDGGAVISLPRRRATQRRTPRGGEGRGRVCCCGLVTHAETDRRRPGHDSPALPFLPFTTAAAPPYGWYRGRGGGDNRSSHLGTLGQPEMRLLDYFLCYTSREEDSGNSCFFTVSFFEGGSCVGSASSW